MTLRLQEGSAEEQLEAHRPHTAEVDGSSPSRATTPLFELLSRRYPDVIELLRVWYRLQQGDRYDNYVLYQPLDTVPLAPFFGVFSGFLWRYGVVMEINTSPEGAFHGKIKYKALGSAWKTFTCDWLYKDRVRGTYTNAMRDCIIKGALMINQELRRKKSHTRDLAERVRMPENVEVGLRTSQYLG